MDEDATRKRVGEALTLFCAWPVGRRPRAERAAGGDIEAAQEWEAAKIDMSKDVEAHVRGVCGAALDAVFERQAVVHTADAELGDEEVFLIDDAHELAELAHFYDLAQRSATLPAKDLTDIPQAKVKLYGVAAGNDSERLTFVKKSNPVKVPKDHKFWAILGRRRLDELDEPLFVIDERFDIVIDEDSAAVLDQTQFERLVRDSPVMQAHIQQWVDTISDALPLAPDAEAALREAAARDSRLWRKLRAIRQRGHLATVTISQVRKYAKSMGLDASKLIVNGQLHFGADDRFVILKLLNEDLYRGELTGAPFEAQRKGPVV